MITENVIHPGTKFVMGGCIFALQTIGLAPDLIFYSAIGAFIGLGIGKHGSVVHAAFVFVAVVFACALFGAVAAAQWFGGTKGAAEAASCISAALFHMIWNQIQERGPRLLGKIFDRAEALLDAWTPGGAKQ